MSDSKLSVLREHRAEIMDGEDAALVHDIGKCTAEFVHVPDTQKGLRAVFRVDELQQYHFSIQRIAERQNEANASYGLHRLLSENVLRALDRKVKIDGASYAVREFIYFRRKWPVASIGQLLGRPAEPLALLQSCHDIAHFEKEDPTSIIQSAYIHSPFGIERELISKPQTSSNLTELLNSVQFDDLFEHRDLSELADLFQKAMGDTRLPINEVTLWDWSYTVASLYKSELARYFLAGGNAWRTKSEELSWRVLRVNFDVLGLYAKAIKITDVLGYQEAVRKAYNTVKKLVEEEYPLGNELYRDTTGIYFTYPDIDDSQLVDELTNEIQKRIEHIEPELAPRIVVGDAHGGKTLKFLLSEQHERAVEELGNPFATETVSDYWKQQWTNPPGDHCEVCPVCRLRPMNEGEEACKSCDERGESRIDGWQHSPAQSIWIDELADEHGRVALLVGKFGLDHWLSGDLVQTLFVKTIKDQSESCVPKNPSPARLRRIWETTKAFWDDSVTELLRAQQHGQRWLLIPTSSEVPPGTVCDGTLDGKPISVWSTKAGFLTIFYFSDRPARGTLTVSWGRGNAKDSGSFAIDAVQEPNNDFASYQRYLTIVSSPDQFMTLLPAGKAMGIANDIYKQYRTEFGKVRNRLPLFLGVIFFQRKTPLMAVMDTARRMLKQVNFEPEDWKVSASDGKGCLKFDNGIKWHIPVTMSDDKDDNWYPYFVMSKQENPQDNHFCVQMSGDNFEVSEQYKGRWLLHARELKAGDEVSVTPSRFAYLFLEHTAERFAFDPGKHVHLLDELPDLIQMWEDIRGVKDMTDTKLRSWVNLLEMKSESWKRETDEFLHLAQTALKQSGLDAAVSLEDVLKGRFFRCLELYLHILKERVKTNTEKKHEQQTTAV